MLIIIFGPPGCGKGTQSLLISEKYALKHISTGDLLRKEIEEGTEFGKKVKSYLVEGLLVPDEIIIGMLMNGFEKAGANYNGVILDGFPRTIAQAEALECSLASYNKSTNLLIDLKVDEEELVNRMVIRGNNTGRIDDDPETIRKRLKVYTEQTLPVKDYYKDTGKYFPVNGKGDIEEIFSTICSGIDKLTV